MRSSERALQSLLNVCNIGAAMLGAIQRFAGKYNLGLSFFLKLAGLLLLCALALSTLVVYALVGAIIAAAFAAAVLGLWMFFFFKWPGLATPTLPDLTLPSRPRDSFVRVVVRPLILPQPCLTSPCQSLPRHCRTLTLNSTILPTALMAMCWCTPGTSQWTVLWRK